MLQHCLPITFSFHTSHVSLQGRTITSPLLLSNALIPPILRERTVHLHFSAMPASQISLSFTHLTFRNTVLKFGLE